MIYGQNLIYEKKRIGGICKPHFLLIWKPLKVFFFFLSMLQLSALNCGITEFTKGQIEVIGLDAYYFETKWT